MENIWIWYTHFIELFRLMIRKSPLLVSEYSSLLLPSRRLIIYECHSRVLLNRLVVRSVKSPLLLSEYSSLSPPSNSLNACDVSSRIFLIRTQTTTQRTRSLTPELPPTYCRGGIHTYNDPIWSSKARCIQACSYWIRRHIWENNRRHICNTLQPRKAR